MMNLTDGRAYVGSSQNMSHRLTQHEWLLNNQRHFNPRLQRAFNRGDVFGVKFYPTPTAETALAVEQAILDEYYEKNALYNLSKDATACMRGRKMSEESIQKGIESRKGMVTSEETRSKLSSIAKARGMPRHVIEAGAAARRGKSLTDEHKAKVSAASKANMTTEAREHLRHVNLGIKHTPEDIEKMKAIKRANSGRPVVIEGQRYSCIPEASEVLGLPVHKVKSRVLSPKKSFSEWSFEPVEATP